MYRILVPLDGTPSGDRAIPWADELGAALGAEICLLRAITIEDQLKNLQAGWDTSLSELPEQMGRAHLEQARGHFKKVTPSDVEIEYGDAGAVIASRVTSKNIDLVVMAGHGRDGIDRALFGSTTTEVVRKAGVPVFSIGPNATDIDPSLPKKILTPLDGSPLATSILDPLGKLARDLGATLLLFRALEEPEVLAVQGAMIPLRNPFHASPEQLGEEIEPLSIRLRGEGVQVETSIVVGNPQQAILETAVNEHVDLIALSTHGHGGLVRLLAGSVAEHLIALAPVPILVYHPGSPVSPKTRMRRGTAHSGVGAA